MSLFHNDALIGAAGKGSGAASYQVQRSLRFNSSDSAYLSRTPASAGNRKTWTWAGWVKRNKLGTTQALLAGAVAQNYFLIYFEPGDTLQIENYTNGIFVSSALYRDVSAWMHLVVSVDTTTAVSSNRIRLYANGVQQTASTYTAPTQNTDLFINQAVEHRIGAFGYTGFNHYCDIMLADVHFIDGQALDPTSFGEFDDNGIWQPKQYTGTYGTNGFHLDFADNSSAAALGTDSSGLGNTWTVNNLSVTAGAGNDSLVDVPSSTGTDTGVGGEVRGNYCTWNPLKKFQNAFTFANGNLDLSTPNDSLFYDAIGTIAIPSTGKYYWEVTPTAFASTDDIYIGVIPESVALTGTPVNNGAYRGTGAIASFSSSVTAGASYAVNNIIGVAVNADAGTVDFYKNGVRQGANPSFSYTQGTVVFPRVGTDNVAGAVSVGVNFGQRPFAYTAPSGFKALNTANLPTPVVTKPSTVMDVKLYTGNGSTQTISGLGFSPDWVWLKSRSAAGSYHKLYDTVRGATKLLNGTNDTLAESTETQGLTAFNSDGFSLGTDANHNGNGGSFVAWTWDAGSSTVTNTQGSITSSVRANATAGFSIVTFTMGSGSYTVGHGLGVAPTLLITKARSNSSSWWTYHTSLGTGSYLALNSTAAAASDYSWGSAPTSTVFTANNNFFTNGYTYVVYAFAPVAGYSSFGSYTGNGSTDGPFVYCGFRPRFIMYKYSSAAGSWAILDSQRDSENVADQYLLANASDAEGTLALIDFTSNGFKIRTNSAGTNTSGGTYIYAAFAESPFQYARAR